MEGEGWGLEGVVRGEYEEEFEVAALQEVLIDYEAVIWMNG